MKIYRAYCNSAYDHIKKKGVAAISVSESGMTIVKKEVEKLSDTNNEVEMFAVQQTLKEIVGLNANEADMVFICTDFKLIHEAFERKWLQKWLQNGWKTSEGSPVKHRAYWSEIWNMSQKLRVDFKYENQKDVNLLSVLKKRAKKRLKSINA